MEKKDIKISGWVIAIIVIVVLSGIFLFAVQMPFAQKYDDYESKHNSFASVKASYDKVLADADNIKAHIKTMQEDYKAKNPVLFQNAVATTNEIEAIHKKVKGVVFGAVRVGEGQEDVQGRTSVEGTPLMATEIQYTFTCNEKAFYEVLNYLEITAKGTYYIKTISYEPHNENNDALEDESGAEDNADHTEDSKPAVVSAATASDTNDYTIVMELYYFQKVDTEQSSEASAA